jgi:hypothetical protein
MRQSLTRGRAIIQTPVGDQPLDIPRFRERIAKYSDEHLLRCGRAAAYMASPAAHYGPMRITYIQQLEELRAEWRWLQTIRKLSG